MGVVLVGEGRATIFALVKRKRGMNRTGDTLVVVRRVVKVLKTVLDNRRRIFEENSRFTNDHSGWIGGDRSIVEYSDISTTHKCFIFSSKTRT